DKYMPVNLTYQTAFVDDDGKLQFRDDVYGRDRQLLAILKGGERNNADVAVERREDSTRRQVLAIPDSTPLWGGGGGYRGPGDSNGDGFFSRLFGSFNTAPAPVPHKRVPAQPRRETRTGTTTTVQR